MRIPYIFYNLIIWFPTKAIDPIFMKFYIFKTYVCLFLNMTTPVLYVHSCPLYGNLRFNFTGNNDPYMSEHGNKLLVCTIFAGPHVTSPCTPLCPPLGNAKILTLPLFIKGICNAIRCCSKRFKHASSGGMGQTAKLFNAHSGGITP